MMPRSAGRPGARQNALEWAVLGLSVLVIGLLVGSLVVTGLGEDDAPPGIRVELRRSEARGTSTGWTIPLTAFNEGDRAAEQVSLEATATVDGEEETSTLEIDFLAARSEEELVLGFSAEPSGEVRVRLVSYRLP